MRTKLTINRPAASRRAAGLSSRPHYPCPPTCVEDGGSERRRCGLVQDQLPQHHARGIPGKPALQEAHPEEAEVAVETESDERDVARLPPVHFVPPRKPLVDEVPADEQAAIHGDVGDPRKTADIPQERLSHCCNVIYRRHNTNK